MNEPIIHQRCQDCRLVADEHLEDARWLSQAGQAQGNPEVAFDLLAHDLWTVIGQLHDEGSR